MERIRTIIRIVVVCCVILSTQSYLTVRLLFEVRQGYIAQTLCVNRDAPELQCEGSCFLSEKLAEEQRKQDEEHRTAAFELVFSSFPMLTSVESESVAPVRVPRYVRPSNDRTPQGPVFAPQPPPPRVA